MFYRKYLPSKLEIQCKKQRVFHLIVVGIISILILSVKNRGAGLTVVSPFTYQCINLKINILTTNPPTQNSSERKVILFPN